MRNLATAAVALAFCSTTACESKPTELEVYASLLCDRLEMNIAKEIRFIESDAIPAVNFDSPNVVQQLQTMFSFCVQSRDRDQDWRNERAVRFPQIANEVTVRIIKETYAKEPKETLKVLRELLEIVQEVNKVPFRN